MAQIPLKVSTSKSIFLKLYYQNGLIIVIKVNKKIIKIINNNKITIRNNKNKKKRNKLKNNRLITIMINKSN